MSRRLMSLASLGLLSACTTVPRPASGPVEVQILGINDFHGNLQPAVAPVDVVASGGSLKATGGAAYLASRLAALRQGKASITVAAGDLIGATPLASAYFLDEPTIEALSLMHLSLASVGNHEFDKGGAELRRMQSGGCEKHTSRTPCRIARFTGARFQYLGANVMTRDGGSFFPATALRQLGPVKVGFIGMTLKDTGTLVTPAGVAGLTFADEAATANALVPRLKAAGADTIVLLIHQGGRVPQTYVTTGCAGLDGAIVPIIDALDPAISTIVSGHTHHAYACEIERGRARRLLTSAGKNGYLVSDIRLRFEPRTRALVSSRATNVPVMGGAADPVVAALVDRYVKAAAPAAARIVGRLPGPAMRDVDDRESPVARLIADAQLAATRAVNSGGAQISFINASGVRTNLIPAADGSITYGQIFALQPFGSSLVVKTLSGAQLKALLEQQFKTVDGRPRIGSLLVPSKGFRFDYDLGRPNGARVSNLSLDGRPIVAGRQYRVVVNNFLASGGDGFSVLARGTDAFDAGLDLDALEAWLATSPGVPTDKRGAEIVPQ